MLRNLYRFFGKPNDDETGSREMQLQSLPLRILTHNIRYATSDPEKNERPWKERLPLILNQLNYHTRFLNEPLPDMSPSGSAIQPPPLGAAFICLQEVLHVQLHDILKGLNQAQEDDGSKVLPEGPYWSHIGIGREDGKTKGEYSPILYPTRIFNLLHFENTWLSPTPDKPSKGWDAGTERILTTGVFEHKVTKLRIAVFNTHLDNRGPKSREEGVEIILEVIDRVRREWSSDIDGASKGQSRGLNYFLAGDFNSRPYQEAYKAMVASNTVVDVHEAVDESARYGYEETFSGFQPDAKVSKKGIRRIDFVWLGPKDRVETRDSESCGGWTVKGYSTLPNVFDDGIFCSDHRCVVADAVLSANDDLSSWELL